MSNELANMPLYCRFMIVHTLTPGFKAGPNYVFNVLPMDTKENSLNSS